MRRQQRMTEEMISALGEHERDGKHLIRDSAGAGSPKFGWEPVVYETEIQCNAAWDALLELEAVAIDRGGQRQSNIDELGAILDVIRLLPLLKYSAFEDEAETRIVCSARMHADLVYLKHRTGRHGMVPYVELGLPKDPTQDLGDGPEAMDDLPIKGVVIGPTRYPKEASEGVRELLRSHGHGDTTPVIASRIPFRP